MYIKIKKGIVITVNVIKASTSKVLSFFISQCLNRTFILISLSLSLSLSIYIYIYIYMYVYIEIKKKGLVVTVFVIKVHRKYSHFLSISA